VKNDTSDVWKKYHVRGRFEERVYGGLPGNKQMVERFLTIKGVNAESFEAAQKMIETSQKLSTYEGAEESVTGIFGKDAVGVFLSDYQINAAIRKAMQMMQPITNWRQKAAYGIRVMPKRIYLKRNGESIRHEDGFEQGVVHTEYMGKPVSSLKKTGYVESPDFEFTIYVTISKKDKGPLLDETTVKRILEQIELQGIGAMHSMGKGQCTLELEV